MERRGTQVKVDETRPGDLDFLELIRFRNLLDDCRRQVSRTAPRRFGEPHRDVGCEIAVRRITGALDGAQHRKVADGVGQFG